MGQPGNAAAGERLQKYLARAGIASRRKCEELILAGRVKVNGATVTEHGARVFPGDEVVLDGEPVLPESLEYYLLNKPAGVVSAVSDERYETVVSLVPANARLFPVGRLDMDTTGLLLLTNDGPLANGLMHPRFEVDKVYRVEVRGEVSPAVLRRLRGGVELEDGVTSPADVQVAGSNRNGDILKITIHEGRKRQVRRMMQVTGNHVMKLHREKYAILTDDGLEPGDFRSLTEEEVLALKKLASGGSE
ncbi:MAG: pseudouridine synthase [Thermoleophilia bacterium]